ncbi:MAG TPA: FmdB family zinc ribbon protein [Opitutaceae bacterium]|nr:FmdB family zinc ribbon protein [Opitutaceae bacterium]
MPTYEYLCQKCGQTFEMFQSMKDAPLKICTCGKRGRVKRLLGAGAGIIFKGSGFYETDYKRRPAKAEAAKPKAESPAKPASAPAAPASSSAPAKP